MRLNEENTVDEELLLGLDFFRCAAARGPALSSWNFKIIKRNTTAMIFDLIQIKLKANHYL